METKTRSRGGRFVVRPQAVKITLHPVVVDVSRFLRWIDEFGPDTLTIDRILQRLSLARRDGVDFPTRRAIGAWVNEEFRARTRAGGVPYVDPDEVRRRILPEDCS